MRCLSLLAALLFVTPPSAAAQGTAVQITTAHGMTFAAQWVGAGDAAPVALLFPMCWETPPETWAPVATALATRGVASLLVTYPRWRVNAGWQVEQAPANPGAYWDEQFAQLTEAAFRFVRARTQTPIVIAGSSCGVQRALDTALRHPGNVTGVVVFAGDHTAAHLAFASQRSLPVLAVTSRSEGEWVVRHQELVSASGHADSRLIVRDEPGHGTAILKGRPELADEIAAWIARRLRR